MSAHGANIVKEKGKYFLFGERHEDGTNAFVGFNCYSSVDLYKATIQAMIYLVAIKKYFIKVLKWLFYVQHKQPEL